MGEHLRFWTDADEEDFCDGSLTYLDAYTAELKQIHEVPDDVRVDYFWYADDPDAVHETCDPSAVACAIEGSVFTPLLPDEHELVHAVRYHVGLSQLFLEEGAAELWGPPVERTFPGSSDVRAGIMSVEAEAGLPLEYYPVAGRFSAWLAVQHGNETLVDLARATSLYDDFETVDGAFAEVTGRSLTSEIEAFEAAEWSPSACRRDRYRDDGPSCAIARALDCADADESGRLDFAVDLSCGAPGVVGPRDGEVSVELTFEYPERAFLGLVFDRDLPDGAEFSEYGRIEERNCGVGCGAETTAFLLQPGDVPSSMIDAGRYLVRIRRRLDAPTDDFLRVTGFLDGACP